MLVAVAMFVVMMMAVMFVFMFVFMFMFMFMFVLMFMMMMMMFMTVVMLFLLMFFIVMPFDLADPGCRGGHAFEIEHAGIHNLREIDLAIVTFNDFGYGLQRADHLAHAFGLFRSHFRYLVEDYDVAELYLLYDKILYIVPVNIFAGQRIAAAELIAQTQCVNHRCYAVQTW